LIPNRTGGSILSKLKKMKLKRNKDIEHLNRSKATSGSNNARYGKPGTRLGVKLTKAQIDNLCKIKTLNPTRLFGPANPRFGKPAWNSGLTMSAEYVEKSNAKKLKNNIRKETAPEKITRELLTKLDIDFVQEKPIGYYICDFAIDDKIIEVQGDFWHANPHIYNQNNILPMQQKNVYRDKRKQTFLTNKGYQILYLWEGDLHNNLDKCKDMIFHWIVSHSCRTETE
jgi:G:T-mismatch repair DNA endonuclease (very short patch repair protein)